MPDATFAALPTTIFEEMSGLARAHGAINLGQGFPDNPGPEALRRKAAEAVLDGYNQYPPMAGLPELRAAVAGHYRRTQGLYLDPAAEVVITSGATEALAAAFLALIEPGDEVIVFQPLYDAYLPLIRRAGGVARLISLAPPHWRFTAAMLEAAITPKTRFVVLNNPVNPTGVVVPDEDLALLAVFCVAHDLIAICDEVWEQVVFEPAFHRPLMAYPGMAGRCVKIGSAGKMFGLTGWKVGFLCAAAPLARHLAKAHQFLTFTTPPNLQVAVAFGLETLGDWLAEMPAGLAASQARLAEALSREGFAVLPSQGTYFLNVDLAASGVAMSDRDFALLAVKEAGVASIPVSALYETEPVETILRLCFAKADATLDEGARRLARARDLAT
ncbi:aminotransferase [Phenylobacterium sp.]|jgi:aspartate/methionine/tyrosine aminotransferase|uniref:aminotransferase n=1 Tax=Phenylobacterium sp. TaxID=1871053 RepID=UPI000C8E2AEE|nr:aminotransferase [Phenylobacterium sp.]MAK81379.1 aminotransferase [Phenylobacterium sp.]|tara:strand:+ start:12215 stop:13375 length:1161 start_codon:yes stop_codon:yes gene_type:complete